MFKNRKTPLLAKKPSDLATIRESSSDGQPPSEPAEKVRRVESGPAVAALENDDPFGSSQFSVPASQMCSQRRYLSQRTNLQKSQSARTSRRVPVNYFEHVLLQCQVNNIIMIGLRHRLDFTLGTVVHPSLGKIRRNHQTQKSE